MRIDAATSDVVEAISLGSTADALAVGDGSVWVASARERVLAQIDPRTNTVLNEVDVSPASPGFLAAGEGSVWVGRVDSLGKLWKYDPRTAALSEVPDIAPLGVATGEGAVWVPASPKAVVKISPTTGEAVSTTQVATAEAVRLLARVDRRWGGQRLGRRRSRGPTPSGGSMPIPAR